MVGKCLAVATLLTFGSFGQESYIQPGLLKSSATISIGDMLANTDQNYYISGFAEYHLTKNISLRGDIYFMMPVSEDQINFYSAPLMKDGVRSFFGAFYHFNRGNFDYNIGFQPGLNVLNVRNNAPLNESLYSRIASPGFNIQTGVTYYVWKYFNFFAEVNYVRANLFGVNHFANNADEIIFSAGLGFQIQTRTK